MPYSSQQAVLALLPVAATDQTCASALAQRLDLPLLPAGIDPENCHAAATVLMVSGRNRCLQRTGKGAPGPVAVDFASAGLRHRRASGARELLGRAVGQGGKARLRVLDATAGLGTDASVLAGLGCDVLLCEREPVIVELLRSGLESALHSDDPRLAEVARNMCLVPGDARHIAAQWISGVDVIYLDPMFPRRSKSAAVTKEMTLFQELLNHSSAPQDADVLLQWALQQDTARVVVKRPANAPSLGQQQPSHCIRGKSVRYDVYVHRKLL